MVSGWPVYTTILESKGSSSGDGSAEDGAGNGGRGVRRRWRVAGSWAQHTQFSVGQRVTYHGDVGKDRGKEVNVTFALSCAVFDALGSTIFESLDQGTQTLHLPLLFLSSLEVRLYHARVAIVWMCR